VSTYVIGDIQGCFEALQNLLSHIKFSPEHGDRLWVTGDLVNRGPNSLQTLRFLKTLGPAVSCVLGNHDLHLLAVACGHRQKHASDTFDDILSAPDNKTLINWLRHCPLVYTNTNFPNLLMVHAGLLPQWGKADALALAKEAETALQSEYWENHIEHLYGNEPRQWQSNLAGYDRLRVVINGLTRLRFCNTEGVINFTAKEHTNQAPTGFLPWFDVPNRHSQSLQIVFGHWSTLGLKIRTDIIALDTGCVWGGRLSAFRLEDQTVHSVACTTCEPRKT
jgi:bis(5'-nucleosyl)-tetraphosphatase (symmetrical)